MKSCRICRNAGPSKCPKHGTPQKVELRPVLELRPRDSEPTVLPLVVSAIVLALIVGLLYALKVLMDRNFWS